MSSQTKKPLRIAHRNDPRNLPSGPGEYLWDHWKARVMVTKRGRSLYVTPPCKGGVEIKISLRTVGKFTPVQMQIEFGATP